MIAVDGCQGCKRACQDAHPVGWTAVRVYCATREPDENDRRKLLTEQRAFLFCPDCFPDWWKGKP